MKRNLAARVRGVEVIRHPEGPVEIKLSGLLETAERRVRRWRTAAVVLAVGIVVALSVVMVILALRWDYEHRRTIRLLQSDLQIAQARARCWEALTRYWAESPKDVVPEGRRSEWVKQCVATELSRSTPKS